MSNYPHPIIAREGWLYVALSFVVALAVTLLAGWIWSIFFWIVFIFVLQFFRDPPRTAPAEPRAVLSAADGRVLIVERTRDPYLKRDALKISVFMNVFNAHSNRSPVDAEVREIWYHPGSFVNASLSKASDENERNALWLHTAGCADISCVQVAGLVARRVLCYTKVGDRLRRGQRYGFIRFGSRVDLYLPTGTEPKVSVGDKVFAGVTILALLN